MAFSSGPTGKGDPCTLIDGKLVPNGVQPIIDRIHPRGITVFHGNINLEKINAIEKWAIKSVVRNLSAIFVIGIPLLIGQFELQKK